jgi:intracellular septation protein
MTSTESTSAEASQGKPAPTPGLRMLIDFGPLAVFFAVNSLMGGPQLMRMLAATAAFMVAIFIAMGISLWKTRHVSPMLWISGALVLVFGGLTLWFRDETFIKVKPTLVYSMFAAVLAYGLITRKPLLQMLLESAYPGLTAKGWRLLTINWAVFFVAMAVLNEIVWRTQTWDFWVGFKLWGVVPLTLIFAMGNIPMLLRHGLTTDREIVEKALPPEG